MRGPFDIPAPALIQLSGGRTSAFMLHCILEAYNGTLPPDVLVTFENTGLEHRLTYRFVERIQSEWGVPVTWLEWRPEPAGYEVVGPNSADRTGFWFETLIRQRRFLPNSVTRFCTTVLKIRTATAFAKAQGWDDWTTVIGIRADEQQRVVRGRARNASGKDPFQSVWPLHAAGITKADVLAFWREQPFDLDLPSESFGNCRLCHLKAREKLLEVMLADIHAADWPVRMEEIVSAMVAAGETKHVIQDGLFGAEEVPAGGAADRFRRDGWTYRQLRDYARDYPEAAQAEVDRYWRQRRAGELQPDLLDNCMCGVGA